MTSDNSTTGQTSLLGDRGWARLVCGGRVLPTPTGRGTEFVIRGAGMEEVLRGGSGPTMVVTSRVMGARIILKMGKLKPRKLFTNFVHF